MGKYLDLAKTIQTKPADDIDIGPAIALGIDRETGIPLLLFKESDCEIAGRFADVHRKPFKVRLDVTQRNEVQKSLDYYNWIVGGKKGPRP